MKRGFAFCGMAAIASLASGAVAGAAPSAPAHRRSSSPSHQQTPTEEDRLVRQMAAEVPLLRRLTPVDSGPGVVVCEPIPRGATAEVGNFGNGCARWLNLIVGGQGELGKTPFWGHTIYALARMRRSDMRLDPPAAQYFSQRLGLTHVVLGQVEGDPAHGTLSYQIWQVNPWKALGPPHVLRGSEAAITAGLPRLAAALAAGLGVPSPRVPAAVGETPAELQWLGAQPWATYTRESLSPAFLAKLHPLALLAQPGIPQPRAHPPFLAAFFDLLWYGESGDPGQVTRAMQALTAALPDNALALAQIGLRADDTGRVHRIALPLPAVHQLLRRYPHNALYHLAASNFSFANGQRDAARAEAEWVVRCAPRSPNSWWNLGQRIFAQADAVRHARYVNQLTDKQMAYCQQRYVEYLPVIVRAELLDPTAPDLWREVSSAAAFDGQNDLADRAFWNAVSLDPGSWDTLWWGTQLYQPKWLADPEKLTRVARLVQVAGLQWSGSQRVMIAWQFYQAGLPEPALAILQNERERDALRRLVEQYRQRHPERAIPSPPEGQPTPKPAAAHP